MHMSSNIIYVHNKYRYSSVKMVKETITNRDATLKKTRKKTPSTTETYKPDEDTYKKIVEFEEAEALKRSPDKDVKLYFQTCENIRVLLSEIANLKKLGTPESKARISEKRVETCMLVAVLKKLNRLEKFRTKSGRDALHQEKLQTDSTKLQLQNLLYELTYLKKEIAKCFQFRSLDEEIDLISEEEFFKNAPASASRPIPSKMDQHQLQLDRLEWELHQRKQLASQCRKLELDKDEVADQIVSKKERLQKLVPQLDRILEVTKPLLEQLGMQSDKVREEHQLAFLLPNPLYLLYAKVEAYTQVYDKHIKVHILGEVEEAKQMKKDDTESLDSTDSDSDQEIAEERLARQKRHNRQSSRMTESQDGKRIKLLASHPLYVQVIINLGKPDGPSLTLDFYYKLKLHVVTIKCVVNTPEPITGVCTAEVLSSEHILRELFPNDNGEESPNPTNHYQLLQMKLGSFSSLLDQLGHPYAWAQRVCGLDFIASNVSSVYPVTNSELSQTSVESVMKILKLRFQSRISLSTQLQELDRNIIPSIPETYQVPTRVSGVLAAWHRITWQEYCECPSTERLVADEYVSSIDLLYRAVITRKSAKLVTLVAIKNNFPTDRTIFAITVHYNGTHQTFNNDSVRDMERAVNSDWSSELKRIENVWLLSAQIRRLVACFDIYLEVTAPEEFKREKLFFNAIRGRNRRHPYKFLTIGGGVFTQY